MSDEREEVYDEQAPKARTCGHGVSLDSYCDQCDNDDEWAR